MAEAHVEPNRTTQPDSLPATRRTTLLGRIGWLTRRGLLIYLVLILLLRFLENSLVYPAPTAAVRWRESEWLEYEDIRFSAADGVALHGRYVAPDRPRGFLLYCHGNGENVSDQAELMGMLRDDYELAVFAFDYRGYGQSEGSPNETGVLLDGEAAYAWLCSRAASTNASGANSPHIVVMGRSLGGAVAVDISAKNIVQGLILENTFSSMPDTAAKLYPWAPVHWLMKNRYNSADKISNHLGPLLQTHGRQDRMIPIELAHKLFNASNSKDTTFVESKFGSHNDRPGQEYYDEMEAFFRRVLAGEPSTSAEHIETAE